jgi:AAA domain-containing protein
MDFPNLNGDQSEESPLPFPVEYTDFLARIIPKPRIIIHNLLDAASRLILGGGSKTYKTWLMSDMALSIVAGSAWLGFETQSYPVLYANFELKEYYAQQRFEAIRRAKALRIPKDRFFLWNLRGHCPSNLEFERALIEFINEHGIMVAFIDPFYRMLPPGKDERNSVDLMPILLMFERVSLLTDCSIVCAAHYTKGNQANKESLDRISGGAGMSRQPDNIITVTNHKESGAFALEFTVRDFVPIEPFVVRWEYPLLRTDAELSPKDLKKPGGGAEYTVEQIFEVLREHDDEFKLTKDIFAAVRDETGMSNGTFYSLWKIAKKDVFKSKQSDCWNLKHSKCSKL